MCASPAPGIPPSPGSHLSRSRGEAAQAGASPPTCPGSLPPRRARRPAGGAGNTAFVDAGIALHAAVVAAAHNALLTDLFARFVPVLRVGLIDLLDFLGLHSGDPDHGDEGHRQSVSRAGAER
ncbi:hypothetical protein QFZ58_004813 [Streptomyces sp. B1I3]|nr:hypothetical protein [Streptomyces sp. B1I3]